MRISPPSMMDPRDLAEIRDQAARELRDALCLLVELYNETGTPIDGIMVQFADGRVLASIQGRARLVRSPRVKSLAPYVLDIARREFHPGARIASYESQMEAQT